MHPWRSFSVLKYCSDACIYGALFAEGDMKVALAVPDGSVGGPCDRSATRFGCTAGLCQDAKISSHCKHPQRPSVFFQFPDCLDEFLALKL